MSIERVFLCDAPECEGHVRTASTRPETIITVSEGPGHSLHFCNWDCVLRYSATRPPVEEVPVEF